MRTSKKGGKNRNKKYHRRIFSGLPLFLSLDHKFKTLLRGFFDDIRQRTQLQEHRLILLQRPDGDLYFHF
jgi:hypothetical protein